MIFYNNRKFFCIFICLCFNLLPDSLLSVTCSSNTTTCTACQGVAGGECDVSPWERRETVSCAGKCVTRRTLYANGKIEL